MIPGVLLTKLQRFEDGRGHFAEIARAKDLPAPMQQSSHSHSKQGVLRGLHFHRRQSDLWYLARGKAQIALVDLRNRAEVPVIQTFDSDANEPFTLFIPPGVAHGYLALTDIDMLYWTSHAYDPSDEQGLAWNDPSLGIDWALADPIVSERDRDNPHLRWQDIPTF